MRFLATATVLLLCFSSLALAKVYFKETFDDDAWKSRWVQSKAKSDYGEFKHTHGKYYGDAKKDLGIQTSQDARFYALSAKMASSFENKGKDLVVQYSVKHEQNIDCGGGYIKLLPKGLDQANFNGDSTYNIMFGPDICGSTKKTHVILHHDGTNHLIEKTIRPESDESTHVYTLVLHPDQSYQVLIDQKEVQTGRIEDDWKILAPKKIKDPSAKKPADWDDRAKIPDPEDQKPADWDNEPEFIEDSEATKPEDWDDDMDGEWVAPKISNPAYKGEWRAKMIANPNYQGTWIHPEIDNPDYKYDPEIYAYESSFVGFDLWQVKSGTIFDNIIVTDSLDEAKAFYEETTGKTLAGEKKMKEEADEEERKKREEERKAREAEEGHDHDDEDDEDDEDDYDSGREKDEL